MGEKDPNRKYYYHGEMMMQLLDLLESKGTITDKERAKLLKDNEVPKE